MLTPTLVALETVSHKHTGLPSLSQCRPHDRAEAASGSSAAARAFLEDNPSIDARLRKFLGRAVGPDNAYGRQVGRLAEARDNPRIAGRRVAAISVHVPPQGRS